MNHRPNPFSPPPAAQKVSGGLSKSDGEMLARTLAKQVHEITAPLTTRITALEKALEYAMAEAAKAAETYLQDNGGDD